MTSHQAARAVRLRAGSARALLLAQYAHAAEGRRKDIGIHPPDGLTDQEAATLAAVPTMSCWWKRCSELRTAGLIADTGKRRPGVAGDPRIACAITARGLDEFRRLNPPKEDTE